MCGVCAWGVCGACVGCVCKVCKRGLWCAGIVTCEVWYEFGPWYVCVAPSWITALVW